ncbi:ankyrin repeat-containing domain protein [Xylaria intraflava]|nr:ankyrin repeat-containing domain protein [Xylaria intraflava]
MHILDLPYDVFHQILIWSIVARSYAEYEEDWWMDVRRALRLKLVSKDFLHSFQPALFASRALDRFGSRDCFEGPRRHYGADQLWQAYLVYRVRNETDPAVGRFVEIQQIAKQICVSVAQADHDEVVDGLCWLALERGTTRPAEREYWAAHGGRINEPPSPRLNLLSAAAYFGYLDLAKELLDEGCCPTKDDLFRSPTMLAALAGNRDVVMLFQEHLKKHEDRSSGERAADWKWKPDRGFIDGAQLRGDVDMLRLVIFPPCRAESQRADFNGQEFGNADLDPELVSSLAGSLHRTRNWDLFQCSEVGRSPHEIHRNRLLAIHADWGNLEMVERFIDHGWDIDGENQLNHNPLVLAARRGHLDIVDLLLRRGANPNEHTMSQLGSALCGAAACGSMSIIRKLYEYGAGHSNQGEDENWRDQSKMLRKAVLMEHTEMVDYFFERGVLDRKCPASIRKQAEEEGLESMTELLEKWGTHYSNHIG